MKPQLSLVSSSKSLAFLALASASVSHRSIINEDVVDGSNGTPAVVIEQSKYNEHQGNLRMKSSDSPPSSSYSNTEITRNISSNNKNDKTENTNIKLSKRQTPRYLQSSSSSSAPGCGGNSGTTHSVYLGCYDDEAKDRAMPFELYEGYSSAKRLGHAALDCERECSNLGYRYFAREFRGQCFCGNSPAEYSKHGLDTGCNCCAENVGPGKMCVWENANHPDSQAQVFAQPIVLPQPSVSTVVKPEYTSISSSSQSSHANNFLSTDSATTKPVGGFRIRLYWENGYNWQGSRKERFWCMECRGSCKNGDKVHIESCDFSSRQKFIAIGKTIRPANNPDLCMTTTGYSGKNNPMTIRSCNGGSNQNYLELKSSGKFELQPEGNKSRCLSQHHHPKPKEVIYAETCAKTRRFDTTYWTTY